MPRTVWQDVIARSGIRYAEASIPNCEWKISHALQLSWNYTTADAEGMERIADAFHKVEENLGALRDYESSDMRKAV